MTAGKDSVNREVIRDVDIFGVHLIPTDPTYHDFQKHVTRETSIDDVRIFTIGCQFVYLLLGCRSNEILSNFNI